MRSRLPVYFELIDHARLAESADLLEFIAILQTLAGGKVDNLDHNLRNLLRQQLTAVHQQFVHVTALREWGEEDFAANIVKVDNADFPMAMKLINYFVANGVPLNLEYQAFRPGSSTGGIVAAEIEIEQRMKTALKINIDSEHPAAGWIEDAIAPRQLYAEWLQEYEVAMSTEPDPIEASSDLNELFAYLIALIEQTMVHAFVHWHWGTRHDADMAWVASGTAMMKSTALVRSTANHRGVPVPTGNVSLATHGRPELASKADRELAAGCAQSANEAAENAEGEIKHLIGEIATYAHDLAINGYGSTIPDNIDGSRAFRSFGKTLTRFAR